MPPTLVHRTLVFRLGRAGLRPEALENAHAFRSHSPGYGGTTPGGQSASIMSTRAPATGPAARGYVLPSFEWVAEAPKRPCIISISGVRRRAGAWPCSRLLPVLPARGRSPYNILYYSKLCLNLPTYIILYNIILSNIISLCYLMLYFTIS